MVRAAQGTPNPFRRRFVSKDDSLTPPLPLPAKGMRYKRRGVDTDGHVANYVETEQLIHVHSHTLSFVQSRGSVPVFWSQAGYRYNPRPRLEKGQRHAPRSRDTAPRSRDRLPPGSVVEQAAFVFFDVDLDCSRNRDSDFRGVVLLEEGCCLGDRFHWRLSIARLQTYPSLKCKFYPGGVNAMF